MNSTNKTRGRIGGVIFVQFCSKKVLVSYLVCPFGTELPGGYGAALLAAPYLKDTPGELPGANRSKYGFVGPKAWTLPRVASSILRVVKRRMA